MSLTGKPVNPEIWRLVVGLISCQWVPMPFLGLSNRGSILSRHIFCRLALCHPSSLSCHPGWRWSSMPSNIHCKSRANQLAQIAVKEAIPYTAFTKTPYGVLCTTKSGGHLGWFEFGGGRWLAKTVCCTPLLCQSSFHVAALCLCSVRVLPSFAANIDRKGIWFSKRIYTRGRFEELKCFWTYCRARYGKYWAGNDQILPERDI